LNPRPTDLSRSIIKSPSLYRAELRARYLREKVLCATPRPRSFPLQRPYSIPHARGGGLAVRPFRVPARQLGYGGSDLGRRRFGLHRSYLLGCADGYKRSKHKNILGSAYLIADVLSSLKHRRFWGLHRSWSCP